MTTSMRSALTLMTALILATLTQHASAQGADPRSDRFDRLDANNDGAISREELETGRSAGRLGRGARRIHRGPIAGPMKLADVDGDKAVTLDEWHTFVHQLDADGNGTIDESERAAMRPESLGDTHPGLERRLERRDIRERATEDMLAMFTRLDRNEDNVINAEDRRRAERTRGPRARGGRHHRIGREMTRAADVDGNDEVTRDEWSTFLATADSNGDGTLSMVEILTSAAADREPIAQGPTLDELASRFDTLDADGDGVLRGDELGRHGRRSHQE